MKTTIIILYMSVLSAVNLYAQMKDVDSSIKIDRGYINVDDGKLFYEVAGKGKNIVLIHDGLLHSEIWNEQFPVFAEKYRVIRYDRRGYGKSPIPQTVYSDIEDLKQIFNQLNVDRAIVFGMSAGGGLAIDFTLKYPEYISALVLIGAVVGGYGYTDHMVTRGGRVDSLEVLLADPQKVIHYFGWEDPYQINPENLKAKEKCMQLFKAFPNDADFIRYNYMMPPDRSALKFLSEISVPTLVLVGEYDIPDVHAHSGVIEAGIPNAKRQIIYKAGHLIPLDQPDAFNTTVMKFLDTLH